VDRAPFGPVDILGADRDRRARRRPGVVISAAIAVLEVLRISSEYLSGMIRTSLIAAPKRGRVLAAKWLVFAAVTLRRGRGRQLRGVLRGPGPHQRPCPPRCARRSRGSPGGGGSRALYLTALAVLSVAAGALLPHPAAAIAAMIAVLFVLPGIAQALPDSWRNPVTEFWPTQAGPSSLASTSPPTPSSPGPASA
jgi:ABC-2 type transport system permease protein